jgi:hypothetical protein
MRAPSRTLVTTSRRLSKTHRTSIRKTICQPPGEQRSFLPRGCSSIPGVPLISFAAEILANAILTNGNERPKELTAAWLTDRNPGLARLLEIAAGFAMPAGVRSTEPSLDALFDFLKSA